MNRRIFSLLFAAALATGVGHAQSGQEAADSTQTDAVQDAIDGLGDRISLVENDVDILKGIKISGYIQAEWQSYDQGKNNGRAVTGASNYSNNSRNLFTIRRGRLKVTQKLGSVMSYGLQTDVTETGLGLREAYVEANLLSSDLLKLDVGQIAPPNYEVEVSSSVRESPEHAQVIRAFYPGQYDIGAMFTSKLPLGDEFRPQVELGVFNGNGQGVAETDAYKDIAYRLVLPAPFGNDSPVQLDLGIDGWYGGIPQNGSTIKKTIGERDTIVPNDATGSMAGYGNRKNFGVEGQLYLDILPIGGTMIKGEWLSGSRPTADVAAVAATTVKDSAGHAVGTFGGSAASPLIVRNQMGYYINFIQNLQDWAQIVVKYDYFDRNTDVAGANVLSSANGASSVLGFGANFFWGNIRITAFYEIPHWAAGENIETDPATKKIVDALRDTDLKDNKTTIRFQYKF